MNGVLVAMGAELLKFQPGRSVAAVFLSRVARHARRPLIRVGAALRALQCNDDPYVFSLSHNPKSPALKQNLTQSFIISWAGSVRQ